VAVHDHEVALLLDRLDVLQADDALVAALDGRLLGTDRPMPPMWKVRIVSCVPGSPIDWAAMTPTASPTLTT